MVGTIDYLAELGRRISPSRHSRRQVVVAALEATRQYERELCEQLVTGLLQVPGLTFYGIADPDRVAWRVPTVSIRLAGQTPHAVAKRLGDRGLFTWHGNFYALNLTERLGIESTGGLLRVGLVHYNRPTEVDRLLAELHEMARVSELSIQ